MDCRKKIAALRSSSPELSSVMPDFDRASPPQKQPFLRTGMPNWGQPRAGWATENGITERGWAFALILSNLHAYTPRITPRAGGGRCARACGARAVGAVGRCVGGVPPLRCEPKPGGQDKQGRCARGRSEIGFPQTCRKTGRPRGGATSRASVRRRQPSHFATGLQRQPGIFVSGK